MAEIPIPSSWCRGDYHELLPGQFLNTFTGVIVCHNRENGLFAIYYMENNLS